MSNIQIYSPVSVLSLIDIGKLADSYRRKSFGGTEKYQDKDNPNIYYSFKPAWQTWKKENSCFLSKLLFQFLFIKPLQKLVFFGFTSTKHLTASRQGAVKTPKYALVWLAEDLWKHSTKNTQKQMYYYQLFL